MNWHQRAGGVRWQVQPFVNGRSRASTAAEYFDNVNPADESRLCEIPVGSPADVEAAVSSARERFNDGSWSDAPATRRIDVLLKLADSIERHKEEIALLDTLEMGKPIQASLFDAETLAPMLLRSSASFADKLFGAAAPLSAGAMSLNTYEPRGVVGAIVPWNFPSANVAIKLGPALAAGNSVVLKPSELSPSSALKIAELALEAGLPEGVLNVVPGLGATVGAALAAHNDVDLISFTGSTRTGRKIMELAGRSNGKPVLLECGGKSPQLVFEDICDLDRVAGAIVQNVLWNQGQVCSAHTRLIAHASIKDALLEKIIPLAQRYRPGDPLDERSTFGPLASPAQRDRVKAYVERGLKEGARAVLRGTIAEQGGCYASPTIFDRVAASMTIAREEIFGPVLCVLTFTDEREAIQLANATEYGLAATVWTRDLGRARRMARAIRAGSITIRTSGEEAPPTGHVLSSEPQKASGFGAECGIKGLEAYSTLKLVSIAGA